MLLAAQAIERVLSESRDPQLIEPGEAPFPLREGCYALTQTARGLRIEVWDDTRVLNRLIRELRKSETGRVELVTERLGGKTGALLLYDAARPRNAPLARRGERWVFGAAFRGMLARLRPGWRLETSTGADLEHSLSPRYPRAVLERGSQCIAAIGCPPDADPSGTLTFGLIWLDYLRQTRPCKGLVLLLPEGQQQGTALRLGQLHSALLTTELIAYDAEGRTREQDPADQGNVESVLAAAGALPQPVLGPESLLQAQLLRRLDLLDPSLCPEPAYCQVPGLSGTEEGIADILAVDHSGRLVILELKAVESVHLPLQALDYWIRVEWHRRRGQFPSKGYFPGVALRDAPPRILLVAPALRFHSTNERLVRFFRPEIEVDRIGLAGDFSAPPRVLFREHR